MNYGGPTMALLTMLVMGFNVALVEFMFCDLSPWMLPRKKKKKKSKTETRVILQHKQQ